MIVFVLCCADSKNDVSFCDTKLALSPLSCCLGGQFFSFPRLPPPLIAHSALQNTPQNHLFATFLFFIKKYARKRGYLFAAGRGSRQACFLSRFLHLLTLKNGPYFQKKIFRLLLCDSERSCYIADFLTFNARANKNAPPSPPQSPLWGDFQRTLRTLVVPSPLGGAGRGSSPIALLIEIIPLLIEIISLLISPIALSFFPMSLLVFAKIGCREK